MRLDSEACTGLMEPFKAVRVELENCIKTSFTFPFTAMGHCPPDGSCHAIPHANFKLNGQTVVLNNISLYPGLTFRALDTSVGELNVISQEVKFEIGIPTIAGYFYTVSDDPNEKPVHVRGSFKLNYETAIAKGIVAFFSKYLAGRGFGIHNMAVDFELTEKPRIAFYSHDGIPNVLQLNTEANGATLATVLWPNVTPILFWIMRDKLDIVTSPLEWRHLVPPSRIGNYERKLHEKTHGFLRKFIGKLNTTLEEKEESLNEELTVPNIDMMVAHRHDPNIWGRFKASSGSLKNVAKIRIGTYTVVHARNTDDLQIIGMVYFKNLMYCYDQYEIIGSVGDTSGKIIQKLGANEAYIRITINRTDTLVKKGKIEYLNANDVVDTIENLNEYEWLKKYINVWMTGVFRSHVVPALHKTVNKYLNEVVEATDVFEYWDAEDWNSDLLRLGTGLFDVEEVKEENCTVSRSNRNSESSESSQDSSSTASSSTDNFEKSSVDSSTSDDDVSLSIGSTSSDDWEHVSSAPSNPVSTTYTKKF